MSVPAFSDIAKPANDLLNKDFYHLAAGTLEVKSNTPNNVAFKVSGKNSHEKSTSGVIEGRYTDKSLGTASHTSGTSKAKAESSRHKKDHSRRKSSGHRTSKSVRAIPLGSGAASGSGSGSGLGSGSVSSSKTASSAFPSPAPSPSPASASWGAGGAALPAPTGPTSLSLALWRIGGRGHRSPVETMLVLSPRESTVLMVYSSPRTGLTVTQTWNTANALESKLELADSLAKGLKAEGVFSFLPVTQARGAKFNLHFKQSGFNGRAFFDLLKGPTANVDAVIGHDGFLAGASAGYDVNKAAITTYSAAVGYQALQYSAAVTASDNLSIFAASYHHKVNSQVEAAAKAIWNSKTGNSVGLEVATKYRLDPLSFVKAKINDRGVAAVAYNVLLREGVTFGIGASFDTQKLDQATHKVGTSFTFEA